MSSQRNYYEVLNSTSTASFDELKRNYKQLILQCHPDKLQQDNSEAVTTTNTGDDDPNVGGEFVIINEAWNTLKDPIKRKHYDAELLLTKFQAHSNIFEHLTLAEMEEHRTASDDCQDSMETYYAYSCRCGGQYVIDESAAAENGIRRGQKQQQQQKDFTATASDCDSASNDLSDVVGDKNKDAADTSDCEVMVECSECSLVIILSNVKQRSSASSR